MLNKNFWKHQREYDRNNAAEQFADFKIEHYRSLEIQTWTKDGKPFARIYKGKSGKAISHYYFASTDRRAEHIQSKKEEIDRQEEQKAARRLARKNFKNPYSNGDILYHSWGYEQTNIDFYQVVKTTPKTITIRQIAAQRHETGWLSGKCSPEKDAFLENSEPQVKKLQAYLDDNGKPVAYIATDYGCMSKYTGGELNWTAYH